MLHLYVILDRYPDERRPVHLREDGTFRIGEPAETPGSALNLAELLRALDPVDSLLPRGVCRYEIEPVPDAGPARRALRPYHVRFATPEVTNLVRGVRAEWAGDAADEADALQRAGRPLWTEQGPGYTVEVRRI